MKLTTTRSLLRRRAFLLTLFFLPVALSLQAQMLFSENMTMKIDSSKPIQGTFSAMVNFKTEHEELFEVKTFSNLNILIGSKRVINLMGRFEFTTYGSKVTVNEGDLHAEFRYLLQPSFEVYPYVEAQWAGTRGLIRKVSTGVQARYRPIHTEHSLMFLTTALFMKPKTGKTYLATPSALRTATTATSASISRPVIAIVSATNGRSLPQPSIKPIHVITSVVHASEVPWT